MAPIDISGALGSAQEYCEKNKKTVAIAAGATTAALVRPAVVDWPRPMPHCASGHLRVQPPPQRMNVCLASLNFLFILHLQVATYAWRRAVNYVPKTGKYPPGTLPAGAYDAIIVGAGPSGAVCGHFLAKKGVKVGPMLRCTGRRQASLYAMQTVHPSLRFFGCTNAPLPGVVCTGTFMELSGTLHRGLCTPFCLALHCPAFVRCAHELSCGEASTAVSNASCGMRPSSASCMAAPPACRHT